MYVLFLVLTEYDIILKTRILIDGYLWLVDCVAVVIS